MYFLPLDRRLPWQTAAVVAAKRVIYDGFREAVSGDIPPRCAGIIADEASAAGILHDAVSRGFATVCTRGPIESPGATVDDALMAHALTCVADSWRINLRYNPDGIRAHNVSQASRARALIRALTSSTRMRVMCDLVVSPTAAQIARGIRAFDRDLRGELTASAVNELGEQGVEPDAWVFEGFESRDDYMRVVGAARRGGRHPACYVRAAGYGDDTTRRLMAVGLSVPGVGGVVLAAATFWEPASAWMRAEITRAAAVAMIARSFRQSVAALENTGADGHLFTAGREDAGPTAAWPQWS